MKIRSKQHGIRATSQNPHYDYLFEDNTIDIPKEHAHKILRNNMFEEVKEKKKRGEK